MEKSDRFWVEKIEKDKRKTTKEKRSGVGTSASNEGPPLCNIFDVGIENAIQFD